VTPPESDTANRVARERNERALRAQQTEIDRWTGKLQALFDGFEW
jgi:hypothetical protein